MSIRQTIFFWVKPKYFLMNGLFDPLLLLLIFIFHQKY
jgi:hypothetical protein